MLELPVLPEPPVFKDQLVPQELLALMALPDQLDPLVLPV